MADLEKIRSEIEKRCRFTQILSLVEPPETDEIDAAVYDAVDEINSLEPNTSYTLDWIQENSDPRWMKLVYDGAAYRVIDMLIKDWTANGLDVDLGDGVALASKLGDYNTLRDTLKTSFDENLEKLKTAALKTSRVRTFSTGLGLNSLSSFGRRSRQYFKSSRIT